MTTLEARIHGLSFVDILDGDSIVDPSGGDLKLDSYSIDQADYAEIEHLGRKEKTYDFAAYALDKADMQRLIEELETAPEDCEFCPYEDSMITYAKIAHGTIERPIPYLAGTDMIWKGRGEIICRDNHFYDAAEQGLGYRADPALPISWSGVNNGTLPGTIDYLMISGDIAAYRTREVDLVFNSRTIRLIDSMIRGDRFVVDRYGNVRHSFKTQMEQIYTKLQTSIGGSSFLNYGSGGTCAYQSLFLNAGGKMLIPFHGPLPVSSGRSPQLKFYVTQKSGSPTVAYSIAPGLADLEDTEHEIVLGWNVVDIPEVQGEEFIAFGLDTTAGQVTISYLEATVDRYLADIPTAEPGEEIEITIQDGEFSSHCLKALHMVYRDGYYF